MTRADKYDSLSACQALHFHGQHFLVLAIQQIRAMAGCGMHEHLGPVVCCLQLRTHQVNWDQVVLG